MTNLQVYKKLFHRIIYSLINLHPDSLNYVVLYKDNVNIQGQSLENLNYVYILMFKENMDLKLHTHTYVFLPNIQKYSRIRTFLDVLCR